MLDEQVKWPGSDQFYLQLTGETAWLAENTNAAGNRNEAG
jgi:hypothetical protein